MGMNIERGGGLFGQGPLLTIFQAGFHPTSANIVSSDGLAPERQPIGVEDFLAKRRPLKESWGRVLTQVKNAQQ